MDGTRGNIPVKMTGLSDPETHFDRQPHTHHVVTGQTAHRIEIPQFLSGRILAPHYPPLQQHQNLSTQVSQDKILPIVE